MAARFLPVLLFLTASCFILTGATTIYFVANLLQQLYTFNTANNQVALVGDLGGNYFYAGGLVHDPIHNIMYMTGGYTVDGVDRAKLYQVNYATGAASLLGAHGIPNLVGLAYDSKNQVLYATQYFGERGLYRLNVNTGAAALIATMDVIGCSGLAYDILRDRLVCASVETSRLYTVDRTTGVQTFLGNAGGAYLLGGLGYDLAADKFWEMNNEGYVYSFNSDGSSPTLVFITAYMMGGSAPLNVLNQVPVVTNLQSSVGANIDQNTYFLLLVSYSDLEGNAAVITVDFDEDGVADRTVHAAGPGQVEITYIYGFPQSGTFCIRVCVDDNHPDYPPCDFDNFPCSKKRGGGGASLSVTVTASGGGDPYFMGFDGVIFKFDGKNNHSYNLISTPFLQFNGLLEKGVAELNPGLSMLSVVRSAAVMWDNNAVLFTVASNGVTNVSLSMEGGEFVPFEQEAFQKQVGTVLLHWNPEANSTRQNLHQSVHHVGKLLKFDHKNYHLELFSVFAELMQNRFFFVDMQMNWKVADGMCYEGVWGRTTCQPSLSEFDMEDYDLHGNLLGTSFAKNQFQV